MNQTSDSDLETMTRDALVAEVLKLRRAIRAHRDSSGHALCWYHPALWDLLPERTSATPSVPEWSAFMEGCVKFRRSLDAELPHAPRTSDRFDRTP